MGSKSDFLRVEPCFKKENGVDPLIWLEKWFMSVLVSTVYGGVWSNFLCSHTFRPLQGKPEISCLLNVPYLCRSAPRGGVSDGPCRFLPCTKFCFLKDLNKYWEDVGINHILPREEILSVKQTENSSPCPDDPLHPGEQPVPGSVPCFLLWCWTQSSMPPFWWTPSDCWGGGVNMVVLNSSRLPGMTTIKPHIRWQDSHLIYMSQWRHNVKESVPTVTEWAPTWVWMSSPVTMLPTARNAGDTTL